MADIRDKAGFVEPMQCLPVVRLPESESWEYEVKLDGYRALGIKSGGRTKLLSRNGKDLSERFFGVTAALTKLPDETVIDGEIVALDENGRPSFGALQNGSRGAPLRFFAFDLLFIAGRDIEKRPLEERRQLLRQQVMPRMVAIISYSETLEASASDVIAAVKEQGLEGVIAKRRDSVYEAGRRSGAWVKMRVNKGQEFVIGGYVPAGTNLASIVIGYYEGEKLIYVARVRNGFTPASRSEVLKQLRRGQETPRCPFANLPQRDKGRWGEGLTAEKMADCRWLKPELVAQIEFAEWTEGDHLRHSKFVALRDDRDPRDVRRETAQS
jgi:DNA ligase D-like protein (predicted ligase)